VQITLENPVAIADLWYYASEGRTVGPLAGEQMQALVHNGVISRETLVWPGFGEWIAAESSTLASFFAPAQPTIIPSSTAESSRTGIFKDKRVRRVATILALLVGLYAIYDGVGDIRAGLGAAESGSNTQITFQGCVGVSTDAVQCTYQNSGPIEAKLCMDIVVTCDDGRHIASSCSDPIPPGQIGTKFVSGFSPPILPTNSCSNIQYENMKSQE
jgi:hypothetical protein